MKKLFPIIILLALACTLASCAGPYKGKEADVRDMLIPLLETDVMLNGYIWGDSFEVAEEASEAEKNSSTAFYKAVSDSSPYKSCDELRSAAEKIYSKDMMKIIESFAFENNDTVMSRFCDADSGDVLLKIDVSKNHSAYNLTAHIFTDTLVVKRSTSTIIECEVEYTAGSSGNRRTMTVRLLKEDGAWKLDSQTWAVSFE